MVMNVAYVTLSSRKHINTLCLESTFVNRLISSIKMSKCVGTFSFRKNYSIIFVVFVPNFMFFNLNLDYYFLRLYLLISHNDIVNY